jgi:class 3 adenylate cyclase
MATERAVERRVVSVLFADLVGFTSLSEELDAEDVTLVQDAYFEAVRETVARHGGQLEKFVGDAAMAVFGAPRVRDDDAERAVRAGLALVAAVQRVGAGLGLAPGALRLRVGVASGETVYGEASAERGPVTGDVVNVAARLQAAGEPETVTIGEATALAVADAIELERLPPLDLKGKSEPVPAWRATGVHAERSRERALGGLHAPTLGRDDEVARLRSLVGSTARVTVVAPPGVGKTRLLDELAAAAEGATVLRARLRPDVLSPFEPVAQLAGGKRAPAELAALARAAGASEARAAVVAELLAAVGSAAEAHPAAEREQLFAAWLEGLDAIAGERAAVWLVEDVHWASPDLLAFLELAGSSPRNAGRLVVASARPVLLDERPEWVGSGERLDLPLLPPRETEELVRELVGDALPAELVARVAERSAGNPLFVEELLRAWAGVGILAAHDAGWRLAAPAEEVELPLTVQAIYAAQLDDLPPPARTAARRAAVAGRRFPREALAVFEVEEAEAGLDTLVRRSLVSAADEDVLLGPSHAYRHALLRDAGYASLARAERARLHVRFADWLAERPDQSRPALAEVIGRHYAAALEGAPTLARDIGGLERDDVRARAGGWFETAARVALGFAAWASARDLAERALELSGEVGLDRARRLHLLGEATASAVSVDEALPLLEESLDVYREAGADTAREGIVDAACALGGLLRSQTKFAAVERLAGGLLLELGEREDAATARLLALRGSAVVAAWDDFDRGRADGERARDLARRARDPDAELEALQLVANCTGDDRREHERWVEIESLARAGGRWDLVISAARIQAAFLVTDEPERALSEVARAGELAEARGLADEVAWVDYERAEAHLVAGSWDDSIAIGFRAIEAAEARALFRIAVRTWFALRPIARARGRKDLIERAFPVFEGIRGASQSPYARVIVGAMELAFAEAGLRPAFVPELEPRLASFDLGYGDPSWLAALEAMVESWLGAGAVADARTALERLRASVEGKYLSKLGLASHALMWSSLLLAEGDATASAAEAKRALDTGAPWWRSRALRALAAAGAASPEEIAEAAVLERSLGIEPAP